MNSSPAGDPFWKNAMAFLQQHMARGDRAMVPEAMHRSHPGFTLAYDADNREPCQWLVVHKGMLGDEPLLSLLPALNFLLPLFANEVFVICGRHPGLPPLKKSDPHVASLHRRLEEISSGRPGPGSSGRRRGDHLRVYLGDHTALTETSHGHKIFVDTRDNSLTPHLLTDGSWESWNLKTFASLIQPGNTVIEVGANVGFYTLLACSLVGPTGRVVAFEANPGTSNLLFRSVEINGFLDRCTVVSAAVCESTGQRTFHRLALHQASSSLLAPTTDMLKKYHDQAEAITVETVTLDDYLAKSPSSVALLKIDAEGSEPLIFQGMSETLRRNPRLRVFFEFAPDLMRGGGVDPFAWVADRMRDGYRFQRIDPTGIIPVTRVEELHSVSFCDMLMQRTTAA